VQTPRLQGERAAERDRSSKQSNKLSATRTSVMLESSEAAVTFKYNHPTMLLSKLPSHVSTDHRPLIPVAVSSPSLHAKQPFPSPLYGPRCAPLNHRCFRVGLISCLRLSNCNCPLSPYHYSWQLSITRRRIAITPCHIAIALCRIVIASSLRHYQ